MHREPKLFTSAVHEKTRQHRMIVWLVRDLEPIPADPGDRRIMRAGMLAQALARRGHETRWITSSFDHYLKRQREPQQGEISPEPNLTIRVLPGPGYSSNISLARIWHNRAFAKSFERFARSVSKYPNVIIADLPTTEAAASAVAFGKTRGIPTIVSIRDLWPDFFVDYVPPPLRVFARIATSPLENQARLACRDATSLVGISPSYLRWGQRKGHRKSEAEDRIFPLGYARRVIKDPAKARAVLDRIGVGDGAFVVSFIGSWGQTYDLQLVLDAARALVKHENIRFVIAGDGAQAQALRADFAELPNVSLPGWLDADEIAIVLHTSSVGLLPYRRSAPQGWPNKAFEYLAYGVYQIATIESEVSSLYAQVEGSGEILGSPDAANLVSAIVKVLNDPRILGNRKARIAAFMKKYDADVVYEEFVDHVTHLALQDRRNTS